MNIFRYMASRIVKCDSLWRPWYILSVICLQMYLIYAGIVRYLAFKEQAFDEKYGRNWNLMPMNLSLVMLIIAVIFFLLFLYTSLTRPVTLASEDKSVSHEPAYTQFAWIPQDRVTGLDGSGTSGNLYATANGVLGRGDLGEALVGDEVGGGIPMSGIPYDTWSARSAPLLSECGVGSVYPPIPPSFRNVRPAPLVSSDALGLKIGLNSGLSAVWRFLTTNCIPASSFLHLLTAYALFLSIIPLQSQQILHYALPSGKLRNNRDLFNQFTI